MVEHRLSFLRLLGICCQGWGGRVCERRTAPVSVQGFGALRPATRSPEGHSVFLAKSALSYAVSQFVLILFSRNSRDYFSDWLISTILIIFKKII